MATFTLKAKKRSVFGKRLGAERKKGKLPAILYGRGLENTPLFLSRDEFLKIFSRAGEHTIVALEIDGEGGPDKETRPALIHDIARDPVTGAPIHADLYQVRTDEKVRVAVPLVFAGESAAVRHEGGVLVKAIQEAEVEALPQNLPSEIVVDISSLKTFEDKIFVRDLKISAGATILADADATVALVQPPRSEEELKALAEKPVEAVEAVKVEAEEKKEKTAEAEAIPGEGEAKAP